MEKQLTVKETAEILRCTEDTVRGKANDGSLKGSKSTGSWLFAQSDVEAYLNGKPSVKVETDEELDKAKRNLELIKVKNQIQAETLGMSVEEYKEKSILLQYRLSTLDKEIQTFREYIDTDTIDSLDYKIIMTKWWNSTDDDEKKELVRQIVEFETEHKYKYHPAQFRAWELEVAVERWQSITKGIFSEVK